MFMPFIHVVLVIIDRQFDISSMLQHSWTYQTLVHDLLKLYLNRLNMQVEENEKKVKKAYDIDSKDFFWMENAFQPFPAAAGNVDVEINKYKAEVEEITART